MQDSTAIIRQLTPFRHPYAPANPLPERRGTQNSLDPKTLPCYTHFKIMGTSASHQLRDPRLLEEIGRAVGVLQSGGVVAFPTDTLYGLGADVFNEAALEKIYRIKGRPRALALPVLVDGWERVELVAGEVSEMARQLAQQFWPGPLTLVLPRRPGLSPLVTGGRDTVAVRQPDHWVPRELVSRLGRPITGTSANPSGGADLLTLAEVQDQLGDLADYIITAGPAPRGMPSTVVDVTGEQPRLLREGVLPFPDVLRAGGLSVE
jgi:L-threonylcarbamoyladenylate synthase